MNCPHCKQPINDDDALFCHFCGESLGRTSHGALGGMRSPHIKWLVLIIVFIAIAGFLFFTMY